MKIIRRVIFGSVVSLLAIAIASDVSPAGKGALLVSCLLLGWVEWRAWRKV